MQSHPQSFVWRQVDQIRQGGPSAAFRKLRSLLLEFLAVIVALAVRALRPLVLIRIGALRSRSFGSFAATTEVYLCERDARMHGGRAVDVFYFSPGAMSNLQLKKMWQRTLGVSESTELLEKVCRRLPPRNLIPWRPDHDQDIYGLLPATEPHLSFTDAEEELGRAALLEMGIPDGAAFVCFHARDAVFTDSFQPDWKRHESTFRNCSVDNFLPAAEELAAVGYYALRMGSVVEKPLPASGPRIIDYATNGRTDFLDVYLSAKCRFFLGSTSGLFTIPQLFRRPLVLTNYVHIGDSTHLDFLFIPKKLWSLKDRRFLSMGEILHSGISGFIHTEQFDDLGIELVENTPEEITAVTMEMEERLNGTWQTTEEDEEMQRRFWMPFRDGDPNRVFLPRIGTQFLRDYQEILE